MKLYNLTHNGKRYVSELAPSKLPNSEYSLVEISYDGNEITQIKAKFLSDRKYEFSFENIPLSYDLNELDSDIVESSVKFIQLPNNPEIENKVSKIFILGLCSTLSYLYFLSLETDISYQFPLPISIKLIDNNIHHYISHVVGTLPGIQKSWTFQISQFFQLFNPILPSEYKIDQNIIITASHNAVREYSKFIQEEIDTGLEYLERAEKSAEDGLKKIDEEVGTIYQEVKQFKKKLFSDLDMKKQELESTITQDLLSDLYDKLPEIKQEIEQSMDLKIYKTLSEKIEAEFADVLYEYKETATYRLREVLNPILRECIEKIKQANTVSQTYLQNAVEQCREYSNTSNQKLHDLEKIKQDFYGFETKIVNDVNILKREISTLRNSVYNLNKLVERICTVNDLKWKMNSDNQNLKTKKPFTINHE